MGRGRIEEYEIFPSRWTFPASPHRIQMCLGHRSTNARSRQKSKSTSKTWQCQQTRQLIFKYIGREWLRVARVTNFIVRDEPMVGGVYIGAVPGLDVNARFLAVT
jgi:hypothetical protein